VTCTKSHRAHRPESVSITSNRADEWLATSADRSVLRQRSIVSRPTPIDLVIRAIVRQRLKPSSPAANGTRKKLLIDSPRYTAHGELPARSRANATRGDHTTGLVPIRTVAAAGAPAAGADPTRRRPCSLPSAPQLVDRRAACEPRATPGPGELNRTARHRSPAPPSSPSAATRRVPR